MVLFYVMEQSGNVLIPVVDDDMELIETSDIDRFADIDYDARSKLVSERLKLLLEKYLPNNEFDPIFIIESQDKMLVYWKFMPPVFDEFDAQYRNDGLISHISFSPDVEKLPIAFTAISPKGVKSIVVRMAVAESALRRGILGVKFTKILELNEV